MRLRNLLILLLGFSVYTYGQNWQYDIETAKELAKEKQQNIVLVFTGSDWCPPCIRLEKNVLSTPEFIRFSSENVVMLRADFPKKKKNALSVKQLIKNTELATNYNKRKKFPVLLVLDKEGNVKGKKSGYNKKASVEDYISFIKSFEI